MTLLYTLVFLITILAVQGEYDVTAGPVEPAKCEGDMFNCQIPDITCLHNSNRCDGEIDCLDGTIEWSSDEIDCPDPSQTWCSENFEKVPGANLGFCYHLKPIEDGVLNFTDALAYCNGLNAFLPRPNSLDQLEALGKWMNLTSDPGYWLGYKRNISAPLVDNGTLTEENQAIRKNFSLFVDMYSKYPHVPMPDFMWRNQPGEKEDERDEMCVAKRRVGSKDYIGADDYMCTDAMGKYYKSRHYVICENESSKQLQNPTTNPPTTTNPSTTNKGILIVPDPPNGIPETYCYDNFVKVPGANKDNCYHLKPLEDGPMNFTDALSYCNDIFAYLPRPKTLGQLEALAQWLNLTGDPIPGYWMGYKRNVIAPAEDDGSLTAENRAIRQNKTLFVDMYSTCPQVIMPESLWRIAPGPLQPGEKGDLRDEMCVAKKRAGSDAHAKFVGADDYICTDSIGGFGPARHYVICERCTLDESLKL